MTSRSRRITLGILVTLLVLGGVTAWLAWTATQAKQRLDVARSALPGVKSSLLAGDGAAATAALSNVQVDADAAYGKTHDPVWALAAHVPWFGRPLATIRGVTETVRELTTTTLPTLASAAGTLQPSQLRLAPDQIDVAKLAAAADPLAAAAKQLARQRGRLESLSPSWMPQVADARTQLLEQLRPLASTTSKAAETARIVPPMLGIDGARRYFLGFQNPAEARGTGGLLGAFAIVTADHGRVAVTRTGANSALPDFSKKFASSMAGFDPEYVARYAVQGGLGLWVNSNLSPDFGEVAPVWEAMWEAGTGQKVDGAIAVDPAALAAILRATGPVEAAGVGAVSADGVEDLVMKKQYELTDVVSQRKDRMVGVGEAVVQALLQGKGEARDLVGQLTLAARAGHVLISSDTPQEQRLLVRAGLSGAVADTARPFAQAVVVNAAGSKLDAYLHVGLDYRATTCDTVSRTVKVTVTLRNDAPTSGLPEYVTRRADHPLLRTVKGQNRLDLRLLVTRAATVKTARLDGLAMPQLAGGTLPKTLPAGGAGEFLNASEQAGHPSYGLVLELKPGQTRTLSLVMTEPPSVLKPLLPLQSMANPVDITSNVSACADV